MRAAAGAGQKAAPCMCLSLCEEGSGLTEGFAAVQNAGSRRPYEALLLLRPRGCPAAAAGARGSTAGSPSWAGCCSPCCRTARHAWRCAWNHFLATYLLVNLRERRMQAAASSTHCMWWPECWRCALPGAVHQAMKHDGGACIDRARTLAPAALQMFARELAAGWTSWGNEVLRYQTLDNFVKQDGCCVRH